MRHFSRTLKKVGRVVVDLSAGQTVAFMVSCPSTCRSHREFIATVVEHFRSLYHFRHHASVVGTPGGNSTVPKKRATGTFTHNS